VCSEEVKEDFNSYPFITPAERTYLENWLSSTETWNKNSRFGTKFQLGGAKFRPIVGDGNCFFSAISASATASKEQPLGTAVKSNELRQKTCDFIIETGKA
jgi:hypothetical protein